MAHKVVEICKLDIFLANSSPFIVIRFYDAAWSVFAFLAHFYGAIFPSSSTRIFLGQTFSLFFFFFLYI